MTDKPKRSWLRFHLLTAVLSALTAAFILWVNFKDWHGGHGELGWPLHGATDASRQQG